MIRLQRNVLVACAILIASAQFAAAAERPAALPTRHVWNVVAKGSAKKIGPVPPNQRLHISILLPLRDRAGAEKFSKAARDSKSPIFGWTLSTKNFTEHFGPTEKDYDTLKKFVQANGMSIDATFDNRLVLTVSGPASAVEKTFHVSLNVYQHPTEKRTFFAPDREPSVDIPVKIWHIEGLDNYSLPHRAQYGGLAPGGGYTGADFRTAYSAQGLTGAGQSIGLLGGTFRMEDVRAYFESLGQPFHAGAVQSVTVGGASADCALTDDCGETAIDIEQALSMAPGADSVIVYTGPDMASAINKWVNDNVAKQFSSSQWYGVPDASAYDPIFMEMRANGQTLFWASGDNSAYSPALCSPSAPSGTPNGCSPEYPSDGPDVTIVGGTNLTLATGGVWASETAWASSGGGLNTSGVSIPSFQQLAGVINASNGGSTSLRNIPDVAGEAGGNSYLCANGGCGHGVGGTSFASPRWAGLMALINQQAAQNGLGSVHEFSSALYQIANGDNYQNDFHDITQGNNNVTVNGVAQTGYNAVPGYDLVTGWGSPQLQNLAGDLAGISACWPAYIAAGQSPTLFPFPIVLPPMEYYAGSQVSYQGQNYTAALATQVPPTGGNVGAPGSGKPWIKPVSNGYSLCGAAPARSYRGGFPPTQVNLSAYFNGTGIYPDNRGLVSNAASLDGNGFAYSRASLGTVQSVSNTMFTISDASLYNAVIAFGQTIAVPSGSYVWVDFLGTGVNGSQPAQTFTALYANGPQPVSVSLSDWASPSNFAGETIAATMPFRETRSAIPDNTKVSLYEYSITTDPNRVLIGFQLPNNSNVAIFAVTLVQPRSQ